MKKKVKKAPFKWGYIALMLISALVGICFFAFNNQSLNVLAIVIGAIVTLAGVLFAFAALVNKERGWSFGFKIAISVAMLICGIVTMIARTTAINIIIGVFGLVLIMDGSFKLQTTVFAKRYKVAGWWVMLVTSLLLIGGSYIVIRYLTIDWEGTVFVLGALFIIDAFANFLSAFVISGSEKRAEQEIADKIAEEAAKEQEAENKKKEKRMRKKLKRAKKAERTADVIDKTATENDAEELDENSSDEA